jgi:phosphatidylglycerophosphate synthase
VLIVAMPRAATVPPATEIAGLPLLRRIALAATRAGFGRVLVQDEVDGVVPLLAGTAAGVLSAADAPEGRCRIVILAADVVPQPQWLRELLRAPIEPGTVYADGGGIAMIESHDPSRILSVVRRARNATEMVAALERELPAVEWTFAPSGRFPLTSPGDVRRAEGWLLRSLIKQNEGFMSRHLERRVSLAITRRLAGTGITPNVMTIVSLGIGLGAAPFFLSASPWLELTGALLFLLHSIVDGCDGEIARLKFQESRAGAILDFWGDNVVHLAVFGSIAVGWSLRVETMWPLGVGAVSLASTLGAAAIVSRYTMRDARPAASGSLTGRLVGALAHRDFIYVIVALSVAGKAYWFLVMSAVGTPLFLLALLASTPRAESTPLR